MPGFIDGHTHLDMPFGGTITADDWDTGTAAARRRGAPRRSSTSRSRTSGGTLAGAVDEWQGKADGRTRIDYGLHVAITNLTEAVKAEIPSLPELGVSHGQDLHGLQGHAALHARTRTCSRPSRSPATPACW